MNNSKSEKRRVVSKNEAKANPKPTLKEPTDHQQPSRETSGDHIDDNESELQIDNQPRDLFHHPVVFDADVERFKNRLESMLNTFKLESLSEILSTKKGMMEEQTNFLSSQKRQHDLMISDLKKQVK